MLVRPCDDPVGMTGAKPTPAGVAARAAAERGIRLPPEAAEAVASAVLAYADDEARESVMFTAGREAFARDEGLHRHLRHRLACQLSDAGVLPVAAPRVEVTYPAGPWDNGVIQMVVPVRRPQS